MRTPLLAALLVLPPTALLAQTPGALPLVGELPASTRALALGGAYPMDSGHADAIFFHPALLTSASGFGLEIQRWGTEGASSAVSAAVGWLGGGVGVGVQTVQFSAPGGGVAAVPGGQDHLFRTGVLNVSERIAALGYARELFGVRAGVVGKVLEERVGVTDDTALLFDVGVASDVGPFVAGLSWRNLGQSVEAGTVAFDRPHGPMLGIGGYGQEVGPLDLGLSATVSYVGEELLPGGGLEVGYWPVQGRTFVGRVGVQRTVTGDASPLSFGFAFWGDDLTLEWAFRPFDGADEGGTHRFGVRWR